jgi:hypothetical protein
MSQLLDVIVGVARGVAILSGAVTIFQVYYRSDKKGVIRRNAGRISGAIVLWVMGTVLATFWAELSPTALALARLMVHVAGILGCLGVNSVRDEEVKRNGK